jgi:hypothetical protein
MRHSRSKDFLRPGQGVIFVPPIPDRPRNTTTFYGRFCPPPPQSCDLGSRPPLATCLLAGLQSMTSSAMQSTDMASGISIN